MKKRKVLLISVLLPLVLIGLFLCSTGFIPRNDVFLVDYQPSDDNSEITLFISVPTSMGYVRNYKDSGGGVRPHYLTFYSTFGGINSPLGAKNSFILPLSPDDNEIFFNRSGGGYQLVLQKNSKTGLWERP